MLLELTPPADNVCAGACSIELLLASLADSVVLGERIKLLTDVSTEDNILPTVLINALLLIPVAASTRAGSLIKVAILVIAIVSIRVGFLINEEVDTITYESNFVGALAIVLEDVPEAVNKCDGDLAIDGLSPPLALKIFVGALNREVILKPVEVSNRNGLLIIVTIDVTAYESRWEGTLTRIVDDTPDVLIIFVGLLVIDVESPPLVVKVRLGSRSNLLIEVTA